MKVKTRVNLYVGQAILEYENKGGGYDVLNVIMCRNLSKNIKVGGIVQITICYLNYDYQSTYNISTW